MALRKSALSPVKSAALRKAVWMSKHNAAGSRATTKVDLLVVDSLSGECLLAPVSSLVAGTSAPSSTEALKARLIDWESKYRAANSANTLKAVRADWQVFMTWCNSTGVPPLPLSGPSLVAFVTAQVKLGKKRSTLNRYVNTIRLVHEGAG